MAMQEEDGKEPDRVQRYHRNHHHRHHIRRQRQWETLASAAWTATGTTLISSGTVPISGATIQSRRRRR